MQNQHQVIPQHLGIKFHTVSQKLHVLQDTNLFHYSSSYPFSNLPIRKKLKAHLCLKNKQIVVFERKLCQIHHSSIVTLLRLWIHSHSCFRASVLIFLAMSFLGICGVLDFTVRMTGGVLRASVTTIFPGFISDRSTGFGHSK